VETFLYEVRHAARALRRRPGLCAAAIVTLALGIGGATAIFSVADAVMLRPLPYEDPDRLVMAWQQNLARKQTLLEISYPTFREWRDHGRSFASLAGMPAVNQEFSITGRGEPITVAGRYVTGDFFATLGVRARLGRTLQADDDRAGAPLVVVVSHGLWRDRLSADPAIVGQIVTIDDESYTVVGVMPPGFECPKGAHVWTAVGRAHPELVEHDGVMWMVALGRLAPGATREIATRELHELWLRRDHGRRPTDTVATILTPLAEATLGPSRPALRALLGAVGLVVLIACANVAGLLGVRALERRFDLAVRHAMGASDARLALGWLLESVLLAAAGGAGGVAVAFVLTPAVSALAPADVPRLHDAAVNLRALAFALAVSTTAAVVASVAPLLLVRRLSIERRLRDDGKAVVPARSRLRAALVVAEVALAAVLLVGAGLLFRTFANLRAIPLGFDADRLFTVTATPSERRYPSLTQSRAFHQELLSRVQALPGVESAAVVSLRPLWGTVGFDWPFGTEGQEEREALGNPFVNLEAVSAGYFRTMGIPIRRGRAFTDRDAEGQPGVVVVSESLAEVAWPGQDAISKRLKIPMPGTMYHHAWLTVVGVAGNARYRELRAVRPDLYMSHLQVDHRPRHLVVRARDPARVASAVRRTIEALDADLPLDDASTMAQIVSAELGGPRFAARLFGAFAAVALLLSGLGVHALLAYSVSRRTREIGVRVALGAQPSDVRRLVFGEGLRLTTIGLLAGLAAAAAGTHVLGALLYGIGTHDPVTFTAAAFVLISAALVACMLPTRRAVRVDPAIALRAE
jgi:predicted permease